MRLPSTREFARRYGLGRGTVVTAFEQLHSEGYLEGKVGVGTFVNRLLPEDFLQAKRLKDTMPPSKKRISAVPLSQYARRLGDPPHTQSLPPRAFRPATPAFDLFPLELWAQIASRRLRRATVALLADVDPRGYLPLRQAVADYLGSARGVRCTTSQVIIVAGIQQALDLTARLTLDPGDPVWVEDPCFPGVAAMFRSLGAKIVPVPVDEGGLNVEQGRRSCEQAALAYVTPAHQFPLGFAMTAERRLALLDWARRKHALIFEDDYDSEYRYFVRPIPALQGLDRDESVLLAGSFSKLLFPSLRLGYVVVPDRLIDKFAAARFTMDRHSSVIDQAILCDFITEGHFALHIRRMREFYAERLGTLQEAVRQQLQGVLRLDETEAGVQAVGWLGQGLNAEQVAAAATNCKVELAPVNRFILKKKRAEGFVLGFAAIGRRELRRGVDCLASLLEQQVGRKRSI